MKRAVIEFDRFGFQYDAQAEPTLYDITLTVHEGEKILILGPSGSGKSTLAHCINGLIPFVYPGTCTGSLRIAGEEASRQSLFSLSSHVGTVLQDTDGQFIGLTAGEDIAFSPENDCIGQPEMKEIVRHAAELTDAADLLASAPHELSGGQKQRVSLAGVIVNSVSILLFDEPLANLDPAAGKQAVELIDDVHGKTGAAILIIEHRLEDVLHRPVDRIILMDKGHIVADMTSDELLCSPLLRSCGIREPLYLTALSYAGCTVTPAIKPSSVDTIELAGCAAAVERWYNGTRGSPAPDRTDIILSASELCFSYDGVSGKKKRGRYPAENRETAASGQETAGRRFALRNVSFAVREGEMLAVAGKNGAGKTTLSKLICGFEKPQSGRIFYKGADISAETIKERAQKIGIVMQNPNQMISKHLISDEVAFGLETRDIGTQEIRDRVSEALRICGLYPFRNWPVSALSFGQKKRVTIASILALEPQIIILDEPTAGQDLRHYTEIMEFLRNINRRGVTVIMITHDMHLMLEYTNRTLVFSEGQIIADDTPARILCDARITEAANLKRTSLFTLAEKTVSAPPELFVQRFIDCDRKARGI